MRSSRLTRRAFLAASVRATGVALGALTLPGPGRAQSQPLPARIANAAAWLELEPLADGFGLRAGRGDRPLLRSQAAVDIQAGAATLPIRIAHGAPQGDSLAFAGQAGDWGLTGRALFEPDLPALVRLDLALDFRGQQPVEMAIQSRWELPGAGTPTWLVPGAFYGNGPAPGYAGRPYPRFDPAGGDPDQLVSNAWMLRTDRASHPAVFAQTEQACLALAGPPSWGSQLGSVGFGMQAGAAWLALRWPWEESPRRYAFTPDGWGGAQQTSRTVQPGEALTLSWWLYLAEPDAHAYDPLLRWLYARLNQAAELRPWFGKDTAAGLAAGGITRWHANPSARLLYETVWFAERPGKPRLDRAQQHVGWVSGVPTALALARHARAAGNTDAEWVALGVIDRIANEAPLPSGLLWADWVDGRGWGTGWSPQPDRIQARTVAEATLYLLRAATEEQALGRPRPVWQAAARGSLELAVRTQRADGAFGSYHRVADGSVADWSGAAGLLWVAALVEGWNAGAEPRYLDAARRGLDYYAPRILAGSLYGATEDADLTQTSEDGYNAILSSMALYRADPAQAERWLALARRAADWTMTFRFAWNVPFAATTPLGQFRFATLGGDLASPRNAHLHPYGLICLAELLALWEATRDTYYLARARDNLLCFWQTLARRDGEFGAGKGMMTEQWYQTDWVAPRGTMLPLSHVWCLGMVLHGWWALRDFGDLVLDGQTGYAALLAPGRLESGRKGDAIWLTISNPLPEPLTLRARLVDLTPRSADVDGQPRQLEAVNGRAFLTFTVGPGATTRIELSR